MPSSMPSSLANATLPNEWLTTGKRQQQPVFYRPVPCRPSMLSCGSHSPHSIWGPGLKLLTIWPRLRSVRSCQHAHRAAPGPGRPPRALGENLTSAVADGSPLKYSELNRELHRRIGAISGQHVAIGLLDRLHGQLVRHQFQLALRPGRPEVSLAEHLGILHAVAFTQRYELVTERNRGLAADAERHRHRPPARRSG